MIKVFNLTATQQLEPEELRKALLAASPDFVSVETVGNQITVELKDGSTFDPTVTIEAHAAIDWAYRKSIPHSLTPRQIRLALNAAGKRADVEAAVAAADQNTKDMWEFSSEFLRSDPVLNAMAIPLGMTSQQIDQIFILGAAL